VGRLVVNAQRKAEPGVRGEGPLFTATFKVVGGGDKAQILLLSASPVGAGGQGLTSERASPVAIAVGK
jgi:hypothetical protein